MNKLEKILAQSVTPEMVAEQLTEQEIEEVIEEYELKIEGAKKEIERAVDMEEANMKQVEKFQALANDWKAVAEEEKEKLKTWRSVVEKAKQALRETKEKSGTFRKGYMLLRDYNDAKKKSTPNKRRAELIDEAKRFVKKCESTAKSYGYDVRYTINKGGRGVSVIFSDGGITSSFGSAQCHPRDVQNKHIGKAIAFGRALGIDVSEFEGAPQPDEIVEGMDVEFFSAIHSLYKRGRVKEYNEKDDYVILEDGYELGEYANPNNVVLVASSNYRILSDTKAKYSDGDE